MIERTKIKAITTIIVIMTTLKSIMIERTKIEMITTIIITAMVM